MSRLGAGIAVAGISNPPADFRSPLPGTRTTSRSPVSRTSLSGPAGFRARGFRGLVAGFWGAGFWVASSVLERGIEHECSDEDPVACVPVNAQKVLDQAVRTLKASPSLDHSQKQRERWEVRDLLTYVLGDEPDPQDDVPAKARRRFDAMVARRAAGEPIPFIKGYTEFRGLELLAEPGVFVPRDSSEFLAEQAIRRLRRRRSPVAVDLATGGGTIALAVANEVPKATVLGTDLSADAVDLARRNAKRLRLSARFRLGDLFDAVPKKLRGNVDVITLHPPYVARDEMDDLPDEIREWEPAHTLTDRSEDGMGLIRRTVDESPAWLRRGGWLLMEVDPDRSRDVMPVYRAGGFRDVKSTKGGELKVTRVIVGRRPG